MSNQPGIMFFFDNFLTATALWEEAETGQYIRVLGYLATEGRHLSKQELEIIANGKVYGKVYGKLKADAKGLFYSERMDKELAKRKAKSEAGGKGAEIRWKDHKDSKPDSKPIAKGITNDMANGMPSKSKSKSNTYSKNKPNKEVGEIEQLIFEKFSLNPDQPEHFPKVRQVSELLKNNRKATNQVKAYFEYKEKSGERMHHFSNWIDSGLWAEDWAEKLKGLESKKVNWDEV